MQDYGIDLWGNNNFVINNGLVSLDENPQISILEIAQKLNQTNQCNGPLILRFPHLIEKQLASLYNSFDQSIQLENYNGNFHAVFPLKVNPFQQVVSSIAEIADKYNYGMEAGSKAELILAMAYTPMGSPITVNGFKDKEMNSLGFMAAQMGHNICLIIEGIGELISIIEIARSSSLTLPFIGIRIRLHSMGTGNWAKSGGFNAKFGLNSTELITAIGLLKENQLIDQLKMIHFHIGSQNLDILPIKDALREAANIYAELKKMGANKLNAINIGGGLPIEYSQHHKQTKNNYSLEEFTNDVVYLIRDTMDAKGVEHPDIYTESGRFIVATHTILVMPVLELFSQDYQKQVLQLKPENPPLIEELRDLLTELKLKNCIEYLHDAMSHIESLLTLFRLGYIDLQDRSNAEILVNRIVKKTLQLTQQNQTPELERLQGALQERYLVNSSFFQSIPDFWGLQQRFPVMPIHHLDKKAARPASIWDITCDSDGEINFSSDTPLYLHDIDLDEEDYYLCFFNIGAYQEVLGMNHNLFTHPDEAIIQIQSSGYTIQHVQKANSIEQTQSDLGYDNENIISTLQKKLQQTQFVDDQKKQSTLKKLQIILQSSNYLQTVK